MPNKATDWTAYYSNVPRYTGVARKVSQNKIIRHIEGLFGDQGFSICELGGGNSFIVDELMQRFDLSRYHIIDNNQLGLDLLKEKSFDNLTYENADVLNDTEVGQGYDLVFSVGLIEHFDPDNTARAIQNHFIRCKPGGYVLITYPTPTLLYRLIRGMAEILGIWKFHDERPLRYLEVSEVMKAYGQLTHHSINWWIGLTQGYIIARKN